MPPDNNECRLRCRVPTRYFMYFEAAADLPRGHGRWHSREDDYVIAARKELMDDLRRHKPLDIVMYKLDRADTPGGLLIDHAPLFTEFKIFLDNDYAPEPYCDDPYFLVYRRKDRL